MNTTYEQCFLQIKDKLSNADKKRLTEDFAVQVNFTNEDCSGVFYIQSKDGELYVEPYDYHDNDASMTIYFNDLEKLLEGKLDIDESADSSQIQIDGCRETVKLMTKLVKPKRRTTTSATEKSTVKAVKKTTTK